MEARGNLILSTLQPQSPIIKSETPTKPLATALPLSLIPLSFKPISSTNSLSLSLSLSATKAMASMNSSVLACNYAVSGTAAAASDANWKLASLPSVASPSAAHQKLSIIKAQQVRATELTEERGNQGRRTALVGLAAVLLTSAAATSSANASIIDVYLEKSKANKELNDKKRIATSGANFARAYTVEFGTCKFPENFTGCQDLAKQKKVKFLSDDLELECEGKDKYKCGSNVFWKW